MEDFDEGEYLFAYDLHRDNKTKPDNEDSASDDDTYALEDIGSESESPFPKNTSKKATKHLQNLTVVKRECIVGKELATMSATAIEKVDVALDKRLSKVKNKEVKSCVLQEKYQALVQEQAAAYLKNNAPVVTSMVHARRATLAELSNVLNRVKLGDWVEVESDYSARVCSSGGIGWVCD